MQIILASASPRRKELMKLIGIDFHTEVADVDESSPAGTPPAKAALYAAAKKAEKVREAHPHDIIIGCDTVVSIDGEILGKPKDKEDAVATLRRLSGRTHEVYTGVDIIGPLKKISFSQCTKVTFYPMEEEEIQWYVDSGEPMDKAGSYGIQGIGGIFVREIQGDYYNVVGLPVAKLYRGLKRMGLNGKHFR